MHKNILLFTSILMMIGCQEDGEIPAYLELTDFELVTEIGEGSNSHKITDAWVFVNGNSIGAYQLPSTVPVIGEGSTKLDIFPVIKENGVLAHSIMYPFYKKMTGDYDLIPGEVINLELTTQYEEGLEFIIEDFDGTHFFTEDIDGNPSTKIEITSDDAFEGNSGLIVLNEGQEVLEAGWEMAFAPERAEQAFIEINYKTNIPFVVGLIGIKNGAQSKWYEAIINVSEEWNKIYFNVTDIIEPSVFDVVSPVIVGVWSDDIGVDEAVIRIDNFKLIREK
ncbi:MAG: hypothetical protein R3275_11395 [Saprospiraceae bacterium]|nr:hypothetical protein [Saprospiraceae bacterium]